MATKKNRLWGKLNWKTLGWACLIVVLIVCLINFIFEYIFSKNFVTGPSMQPSFETGDQVISVRNSAIKRGDIIILKAPDKKDKLYIKRVIGLPGDVIKSQEDGMYINHKIFHEDFLKPGSKLREPLNGLYAGMPYTYTYTFNIRSLAQTPDWQRFYSKKYLKKLQKANRVPKDDYFVLGYHRTVSKDSRMIGFIKKKAIVGRVALRYWPLSEFTVY